MATAKYLVWRMWTPQGWPVPGFSGDTEADAWVRYAKLMGRPWKVLEAEGYRCVPTIKRDAFADAPEAPQ